MADAPVSFLEFDHVSKRFGATLAVDDVSLLIARGAFVALVGASGSGKSTLLKTANRLVEPDAGRVLIEGADVVAGPAPLLRRRIGYVFQGVGLFTHRTVGENIAMVPLISGAGQLSEARIGELLDLVELPRDIATRYPEALSGGQRQRVGIARALAGDSHLLLMDEPFGALDPITRASLGERVRALHEELGLTTVMVTHDMAEALLLASRVLVMEAGRIVADETPATLLAGAGGEVAQALVAVPREQARKLGASA
ncbi:ABC transporter ATP-binding protein [Aurantiacibacter flavus]|uniref:ABC transporter ATP-binding protein n=1 Tax=Aurantiacibacter flavus TaxID=3145232 RepID=A0ABV0CZ63_9SPHN